MRARRITLLLSSIALLLIGLPLSGSAAAPPVGCGATITHNTTLTADVGPCSGDGLIVTASNIRLNLGGHQVFGATVQSMNNYVGVLLQNVQGVTVAGPGSVSRFSAGVAVVGGQGNTVRGVFAHDNNSTQWSNDNPDLANFGDGIDVESSSHNVITQNTVSGNGPFSGISIFTNNLAGIGPGPKGDYQLDNTVSNNTVVNNDIPDVCSGGAYYGGTCNPGDAVFSEDIGIRVEGPGADNNTVSGNSVSGSGRDGISVINENGPPQFHNMNNRILNNNSSSNGTAVTIADALFGQLGGDGLFNRCFAPSPTFGGSYVPDCPSGTVVIGNTFDNNPAHGLNLDESQFNTVKGNVAFGNGFGTQTYNSSDPPYTDAMDHNNPPCNTNTWLGNEFGTVNDPCIDHTHAAVKSATAASTSAAPPQPARPGGRATL